MLCTPNSCGAMDQRVSMWALIALLVDAVVPLRGRGVVKASVVVRRRMEVVNLMLGECSCCLGAGWLQARRAS